jgi:Spy/CpxP family protein refolding chaperone
MYTYPKNQVARFAGALLLITGLSGATARAQTPPDSAGASTEAADTVVYGSLLPAEMREQMRMTIERLELTDDQRDPVHSIIERSSEQRLAVMEKYGLSLERMQSGDLPDMRTLRRMSGEMEALSSDTKRRLKRILTRDQMRTWNEIERARQQQMRSQMRSRR